MAKAFGLISLIFCGFMAFQAMGDKSEDLEVNPAGFLVREADETEHSVSIAAEPSSESMEEAQGAEAPAVRRLGPSGKESKHHSDKSVAGGGVIIGGLVTAVFAAVFCYIRVTRKRGGVY